MTNLNTSISLNFKDKYSDHLKKIITLNKKFESSLGSSKLKINSFNTGLDKAKLGLTAYGNKLNQVKAKQKALASGIGSSVAKIAAVWANVKIGEGFLTTSANVEKFRTTLKILEGSQEKTKKSLGWIEDFARTVADTQTGENKKLKDFGIKARTVGQQITYEYTDVLTKQNKFVSVNKKNRAEITKTLTAIMKSNYGAVMQKQNSTLLDLWSNINNYYTRFRLMVTEDASSGGPFEKIKEKVKELLSGVQNVSIVIKAIFQVIKAFNNKSITINVSSFFEKIKEGAGKAIVIIIGGIIIAISSLIFAIDKLFKKLSEVFGKIKEATNTIKKFFGFKNKDEDEDEEYNTDGTSRFDTKTRFKNKGEDEEYNTDGTSRFDTTTRFKNKIKDGEYNTAVTPRFDTTTRFNYGRAAAIESPNYNNIKAEMDVNITNEGVPEVKNIKSTGKIPLAVKARGSMSSILS